MDSFLLKVVKSVFREELQIENIVFVLPNQRAGVYLKKHLVKEIQQTSFFPKIITFDNFVEKISNISKIPSLELLINFYEVYKKNTPFDKLESFDLFSNWATTVLDDFNEIDAYLVDSNAIFSSLKDINELHNWNPSTALTKNYLAFFKNLEKYYQAFYKVLQEERRGYQGFIFRQAVEGIESFIENTDNLYVFAGFNHLRTSESQIVQELLAADKARIFWDISENMLQGNHPAGQFIRAYQSEWSYYKKNKFNWISNKDISIEKLEIVGVSKSVGMMKYSGELLGKAEDVDSTALVLADQNLLPIALNSLPEQIEKVNITMGVPLRNFPFTDLIDSIFQFYASLSLDREDYYYKPVLRILQHPILQTHFNHFPFLVASLVENNSVYYNHTTIKELADSYSKGDSEVVLDLFKTLSADFSHDILTRINALIDVLKPKLQGIEKEVLYRHHQLNQQMFLLFGKKKELLDLPKGQEGIKSLYSIYKKVLFSENFNFIGEPLQGLQIMGFLETQALYFKQIILSSLNEGVLPKGKRTNSFIPFDVRKHYKLPTYQEENAIVSYHFYRLLATADRVSLLYNSQTDTFGGGEKSQFLTQLQWKYPNIKQVIVNPIASTASIELLSVRKSSEIIDKLLKVAEKGFSPSSLSTYIYNPIIFYQDYLLGIEELNEVEETVADNTMGTVIHETLYKLYKPLIGGYLNEEVLKELLPKIQSHVQIEFRNVYRSGQYSQGKNKLIYEVIINFVERYIKEEIKAVRKGQAIRIIALEEKLSATIKFPKFEFPIKIRGTVDRIEEVDGVLRIVDFKSGKVESSQLRMNDFSKILADYKFSKGLQVLLYAYMYSQTKDYKIPKELQAGIISFKNFNAGFISVNFSPLYTKADHKITDIRLNEFLTTLEDLLLEIFDPNIPFIEKEG